MRAVGVGWERDESNPTCEVSSCPSSIRRVAYPACIARLRSPCSVSSCLWC